MDITAQTAHGFQLSEFRDHCRIPWTTDDPAIQRSLDGGVSMWETSTNWYLRATTITLPITPEMTVPFGPAPTITSVVKNQYGALVSTVTDQWFINRRWGARAFGQTATGTFSSAYEYIATMQVAGSVTPAVKSAVFDLGYHLWRDREGSIVGAMVAEIPLSLRTIIANHQLGGL
mgnify:FL=1|tara:strand:+ start:11 stop:535 length:525 start_codon:yes stop_codon:yes gene_type:complete